MTRSPRVVRVATETGQSPMTGPWKILMVIETSGGGSGRHVLDLAGSFSDRGHEVHILYSPRRAEPRFVSELEKIDAVKTTAVDLRRSPHYSDIQALRVIGSYLVQQGPFDVVHGHSSKGALACIAARRLRIASIFTPHAPRSLDPTIPRPLRRVFRLFDSLLVSSADAIIAVSDEEYAFLRAKGLSAERLFKVNNGLAPQSVADRNQARSHLGLDEGQLCVGFIGRLARQKAPHRLIDAMARLVPEISNLSLVMVGDGPLREDLQAQARRLGVDGGVTWLGDCDARAVISAFDIFAMPSLYEAMPYVLLEAAAAGLPIVATDIGGTGAVIVPGTNGYVVPQGKPEELSQKLREILLNSGLRTRMGLASRAISGKFTLDQMMNSTIEIYRNAVAARRSGMSGDRANL